MKIGTIGRKILKLIDEDEQDCVNFLQRLVKIPSVVGKEKAIQDFVIEKFESMELGIDVWEPKLEELQSHKYFGGEKEFKDRPVVVGTLRGSGGGRSLILNGHVDVVSPEPVKEWKHNPWGGEIEDGKLYGRGACDMKGGVASMIMAVDCLQRAGVHLKGDVILQSVPDEELGGGGTLACVLKGYKADAGVVTEPSNLVVAPAHRGVLFFKVMVKGKAVHSSRSYLGVNAFEKAYEIYTALQDLQSIRKAEQKHPLFKRYPLARSVTIGKVKAGIMPAQIPGEATMEGMIAFIGDESVSEVEKQLREYVKKRAMLDSWLRTHEPTVEFFHTKMEPGEISMDHPIVKVFVGSHENVTGKPALVEGMCSATDARLLTRYAETPTIIFGPGSIDNAHTIDEFIQLNNYITVTKILALSILNWCGYR